MGIRLYVFNNQVLVLLVLPLFNPYTTFLVVPYVQEEKGGYTSSMILPLRGISDLDRENIMGGTLRRLFKKGWE